MLKAGLTENLRILARTRFCLDVDETTLPNFLSIQDKRDNSCLLATAVQRFLDIEIEKYSRGQKYA
jgi:hypothetical protein